MTVPRADPRTAGPEYQAPLRLARFIRDNVEPILAEWETFARTLPGGGAMDVRALRDHAKEMLLVIAADLERPQSDRAQDEKARGERDAAEARDQTAAQQHGTGRAGSGFTVSQMVAEFRALRASVTRLWLAEHADAAHTDLTDLIRFNEAIDQAIAESVSRFSRVIAATQERFLAILSHDLRTPLGAIITSTRFMLDAGGLEEPNRTLVARASSSARRMNQMVLDLVEFTRTRLDDDVPVVRAEVDARRLVHDVLMEIAASYPESVVQVETAGDLSGQWDADRLAQALTNLVGNAVQHGAAGRPIRVSARGVGDEVTLAVHNEGPPIPSELQAVIFQEGTRVAGPAAAADRRHQGLGLYIVERIVAAHGGTVSVHSSAAEGTTFTIRLPRRP
ncbi:MAG: sensor histidine kinase [Gemmatimonadetes bacterium]|jgi:signal transduction histidine kinase|nr:sensor histidine kinase [Gemmatimonadota bacterium]